MNNKKKKIKIPSVGSIAYVDLAFTRGSYFAIYLGTEDKMHKIYYSRCSKNESGIVYWQDILGLTWL